MPFISTPLHPSATSLVSVADFTAYISIALTGHDPVVLSLDDNNDYAITVRGLARVVASNRAVMHGGVDGVWFYRDVDNVWVEAVDEAAALVAGREAVIQLILNAATASINVLPQLCGAPILDRTAAIDADFVITAASTITAPVADNAFDFLSVGDVFSFVTENNTDLHEVAAIDTDSDPHVLTITADTTLVVEPILDSTVLGFTYTPELAIPRNWKDSRFKNPPPDDVIPAGIKLAVCRLATSYITKGDLAAAADARYGLKEVEIFEAVTVEFAESPEAYAAMERRELPSDVLEALSNYLCEQIRGYGRKKRCVPPMRVTNYDIERKL